MDKKLLKNSIAIFAIINTAKVDMKPSAMTER